MTTYGTIPTNQTQPTSNHPPLQPNELYTLAKDKITSGLAMLRPWSQLLTLNSISLPSSFENAISRAKTNTTYFLANYVIILLLTLLLSLLTHPLSLIVFTLMMAAWGFLYFLRDVPLMVFGRVVDDKMVLAVLAVVTVVFLLVTDVTMNIVGAVVVGVGVVLAHAAMRGVEDVPVADGGVGDERVGYRGGGVGGFGERLPLKDAASASYSF